MPDPLMSPKTFGASCCVSERNAAVWHALGRAERSNGGRALDD